MILWISDNNTTILDTVLCRAEYVLSHVFVEWIYVSWVFIKKNNKASERMQITQQIYLKPNANETYRDASKENKCHQNSRW